MKPVKDEKTVGEGIKPLEDEKPVGEGIKPLKDEKPIVEGGVEPLGDEKTVYGGGAAGDQTGKSGITYEEYLERYGTLTYRNVGTSMLPLLKQGRDLFTIKRKGQGRFRKYDVVLYRRPPHHYVLHRIIKVRDEDYVILGDNCVTKEYGIKDEDILGVMTSFVRKGKQYGCDYPPYQLYARICVACFPLRRLRYLLKVALRRLKKR